MVKEGQRSNIKKGKRSISGDSAIINSLNSAIDGNIGESEAVQLTEQELHHELVKWVGKLELESIDLREKSTGLTSELIKINQLLSSTVKILESDMTSLKNNNKDSLKSMLDVITKSCEIFKRGNILKSNPEQSQILKKLESLKEGYKNIGDNNKHIRQMITSNNNLKNMIKLQQTEQQNMSSKIQKNYEQLNSKLTQCFARLDAVYNLQVDFNSNLGILIKSQDILSSEIQDLKNNKRWCATDSQVYLTPNNSINESSSPSQLQQLVISRNYKTHGTRSLQHAPRTRSRVADDSLLQDTIVRKSGTRTGTFNSKIQKNQLSLSSYALLLPRGLKTKKIESPNINKFTFPEFESSKNILSNSKQTLESSNDDFINLLSDDSVLTDV